jgi:hypothetical protein
MEIQDLSFSQWPWRLLSYRTWNCEVWYVSTNVSQAHAATIMWQSRKCVQWMNNHGYLDHHCSRTRMSVIFISGKTWWQQFGGIIHAFCAIHNASLENEWGTFSEYHKLHYVAGKHAWLLHHITFSKYCNIIINDVGRTHLAVYVNLSRLPV